MGQLAATAKGSARGWQLINEFPKQRFTASIQASRSIGICGVDQIEPRTDGLAKRGTKGSVVTLGVVSPNSPVAPGPSTKPMPFNGVMSQPMIAIVPYLCVMNASGRTKRTNDQTLERSNKKDERILCNHCRRTSGNGVRCIGMCVADSDY